jgi:hypothetical protein
MYGGGSGFGKTNGQHVFQALGLTAKTFDGVRGADSGGHIWFYMSLI